MTPDQFAAWLDASGVVEIEESHTKEEQKRLRDGHHFYRQSMSGQGIHAAPVERPAFFVYVGDVELDTRPPVQPVVWSRSSGNWFWYDHDANTERAVRIIDQDPIILLRLELARQVRYGNRRLAAWEKQRDNTQGLMSRLGMLLP